MGDKRWDGRGQVYTIDEDICLDDLPKGVPFGGFGHVPFDDVGVGETSFFAHVNGTAAAAAERADDEDPRGALGERAGFGECGFDVGVQCIFIWIGGDGGERGGGVDKLMGEVEKSESGTTVALAIVSNGRIEI